MSCDEPPPPELLEGIAQFNRGEFFEQHETLELLWRAERRDIRYLYQGILQIGVAFHHLRRLNHHGTVYMLTRGPQLPQAVRAALPVRGRPGAARRRRGGAAARSSVSGRPGSPNSTGAWRPRSGSSRMTGHRGPAKAGHYRNHGTHAVAGPG